MEMAQARARLTSEIWATAALEAIGEGGLGAVAVEPLAARLGTTKGSFYWHFPNRDALVAAALAKWEERHTGLVIEQLDATEPDPETRLRRLFGAVVGHTGDDRIEVEVLAAADHPLVRPVVERVTRRRIDYLIRLFKMIGFPPREAREAARAFAEDAGRAAATLPRPACIVGAGETTVVVKGNGLGGRNQEFALAMISSGLVFGSIGTDGIDGPTDAAGAVVDPTTAERAAALGLDPQTFLSNNDSYHFFSALDDLLRTGPTGTNVGDVQAALVP